MRSAPLAAAPWLLAAAVIASVAEESDDFLDEDQDSKVITLTDKDFHDRVQNGADMPWFIEFYAPWCGHCKALKPHWERLAELLDDKVRVAKVDATTETQLAKEFDVQGFPTLKLVWKGTEYSYEDGARDTESLAAWATNGYKDSPAVIVWKDRGALDSLKRIAEQEFGRVMQVHGFMPELLPSVFMIGAWLGLTMWLCCLKPFFSSSCRREFNEFFDTKLVRDGEGSLGMGIVPSTMAVSSLSEGRPDLQDIRIGDTIVAVNGAHVVDAEDYRRLAHGVKEVTLSFARLDTSRDKDKKTK